MCIDPLVILRKVLKTQPDRITCTIHDAWRDEILVVVGRREAGSERPDIGSGIGVDESIGYARERGVTVQRTRIPMDNTPAISQSSSPIEIVGVRERHLTEGD